MHCVSQYIVTLDAVLGSCRRMGDCRLSLGFTEVKQPDSTPPMANQRGTFERCATVGQLGQCVPCSAPYLEPTYGGDGGLSWLTPLKHLMLSI